MYNTSSQLLTGLVKHIVYAVTTYVAIRFLQQILTPIEVSLRVYNNQVLLSLGALPKAVVHRGHFAKENFQKGPRFTCSISSPTT
jgi:hypothetical protein